MANAKTKHQAKVRRVKLQHEKPDRGLRHPVDPNPATLAYKQPAARGPRPDTFGKQLRRNVSSAQS